jgi:hypothetical protein
MIEKEQRHMAKKMAFHPEVRIAWQALTCSEDRIKLGVEIILSFLEISCRAVNVSGFLYALFFLRMYKG